MRRAALRHRLQMSEATSYNNDDGKLVPLLNVVASVEEFRVPKASAQRARTWASHGSIGREERGGGGQ
jgi:hypothetical protein